jgi:hypothetical protein
MSRWSSRCPPAAIRNSTVELAIDFGRAKRITIGASSSPPSFEAPQCSEQKFPVIRSLTLRVLRGSEVLHSEICSAPATIFTWITAADQKPRRIRDSVRDDEEVGFIHATRDFQFLLPPAPGAG